jgi:uncharacterized protein YllA (UPF0747 family)
MLAAMCAYCTSSHLQSAAKSKRKIQKGQHELRYEELPEIPRIWIDFLDSRLSFLPGFQAMQALSVQMDAVRRREDLIDELFHIRINGQADSPQTAENIRRLQRSQSGVVIANSCVSLLGGPMFQMLKCLTAIRVCEELEKQNISAVPLCWISDASPVYCTKWGITLPDRASDLHHLQLPDSERMSLSPRDPLPRNEILALISRIEELGGGNFDGETLQALRSVSVSETTVASASARVISELTGRWGMIVLDADAAEFETIMNAALAQALKQADSFGVLFHERAAELDNSGYVSRFDQNVALNFLKQNSLLPVLACVLDPWEVFSYAAALPVFEKVGLSKPVAWPQVSATIIDARSRRILRRHNLSLPQLYSGEERVVKEIIGGLPHSAIGKLDNLKLEVERCIAGLKTPDFAEDDFMGTVVSHQERVLYQLDRLRRLSAAGHERRGQAVSRQIHRVCNLLAPNRRLQERELSGIQIPLRYSREGINILHENMDIRRHEHQLISMD